MSHQMDRRRFLGLAAGAGIAASGIAVAGGRLLRHPAVERWEAGAFPVPSDARVAVLQADSYAVDLEGIVFQGLRSIGADVRGARVVLKPNLVEYDSTTAVNTDPRLVGATVIAMRRLGARHVVVAEGPGHRRDTRYLVERSGLGSVLREVAAPFVDLNVDAVRPTTLHSSYASLQQLLFPRTIADADIVVSMPKMKMHHWAGVTLSLKNCFGSVPGRIYGWPKNALHWAGLEQAILDVSAAVRPAFAIVDGIVAMGGNGPITGDPVPVGVVVIGDDPVATDVTAAGIMGVDPEKVPYLVEAGRFLGQFRSDRITMVGEDPSRFVAHLGPAPGFSNILA
jgi:uncharacterized protein (DUF362 family)